jgi:hypothetical protein
LAAKVGLLYKVDDEVHHARYPSESANYRPLIPFIGADFTAATQWDATDEGNGPFHKREGNIRRGGSWRSLRHGGGRTHPIDHPDN